MELQELKSLQKSIITDLYDLGFSNFVYSQEIIDQYPNLKYRVNSSREMRMDLISQDLYGEPDFADFLMLINNIKNIMSINENTIIQYVPKQVIPAFRPELSNTDNIRKDVSLTDRQTRKDENREEFKNELPVTMTSKDYNPVKYNDGGVILGGDIFNV